MSVFLFVLDGLGVFNENSLSTYQNLTKKISINNSQINFLLNAGLNRALTGKYNLLFPKYCYAGSLEGHREMFDYYSNEEYTICDGGLSKEILDDLYIETRIKCIGNIKGRGRDLIPVLSKNKDQKSVILYIGIDSTISLAYDVKEFRFSDIVSYANKLLRMLHDKKINIRKLIIRGYINHFSDLRVRKEIFKKVDFDEKLSKLGFSKCFVNPKVQDILCLSGPEIIHANCDNECYNYILSKKIASNSLYFINFPDFDYYAHQCLYSNCKNALVKFNGFLPVFLNKLSNNDYVIITSDHGVNFINSDLSNAHIREGVLFLCINDGKSFVLNRQTGLDNIYKTIQKIQKNKTISTHYSLLP